MDLQGELACDWVPPEHGEDFDLLGVDGRELGGGKFEAFGVEAESVGAGVCRAHPDVSA